MQEYLAEIATLKHLTMSAVEITAKLIAPDEIEYKAGQTIQLKLHDNLLEVPIATPPSENNQLITFCIDSPKQGWLHDFIQNSGVGAQIKIQGPSGGFVIKDESKEILCIAQATGVAMFAAIIPTLLVTNNYRNKIKLVYELNSEEEVFYFEKFSVLARKFGNFSFMPVLVRPHAHWPGEVGTASTFVQVSGKSFKDYDVYVSGSRVFVDMIVLNWHKYVSDQKDITTYFTPHIS